MRGVLAGLRYVQRLRALQALGDSIAGRRADALAPLLQKRLQAQEKLPFESTALHDIGRSWFYLPGQTRAVADSVDLKPVLPVARGAVDFDLKKWDRLFESEHQEGLETVGQKGVTLDLAALQKLLDGPVAEEEVEEAEVQVEQAEVEPEATFDDVLRSLAAANGLDPALAGLLAPYRAVVVPSPRLMSVGGAYVPKRSMHSSAAHHFPRTPEEFDASAILTTSKRTREMYEVDPDSPWHLLSKDGKRFLDGSCGIAVASLGNLASGPVGVALASYLGADALAAIVANKDVMDQLPVRVRHALIAGAESSIKPLAHISATHNHKAWEEASRKLVDFFDADGKVFWTSDGTAANEAAFKMMQSYHAKRGNSNKKIIITFAGAFHGRTLASLAATGNEAYLDGFYRAGCFHQIPYGDVEALERAIAEIGAENIAGVFGEPMQGEGGGDIAPKEYWQQVRQLCNEHDMLLGSDQVQVGMGRCGSMFMWPDLWDVVTSAKALGGGVAVVSAAMCRKDVAAVLTGPDNTQLWQHGVTHTGFPPSMNVAMWMMDETEAVIASETFRRNVALFETRMGMLQERFSSVVKSTQGLGFNWFFQLQSGLVAADVAERLRDAGLLVMPAGRNSIRLQPALNMPKELLEEMFEIAFSVCEELAREREDKKAEIVRKIEGENSTIFRKEEAPGVSYHALTYDDKSPLLREYFALRKGVYDKNGMPYYENAEPDSYDKRSKDNVFIVAVDSYTGKVVGGRRMLVHMPGSDTILHIEENSHVDDGKHKSMQEMLPHLDLGDVCYAELGGIVVDPERQGNGVAGALYRITSEVMKERGIVFAASEVTPSNIRLFADQCAKYFPQVVCRHDHRVVADGSFDWVWMVSCSPPSEFPLLSKEMKKSGVGRLPTDAEIAQNMALQSSLPQNPTGVVPHIDSRGSVGVGVTLLGMIA